MRQDSVRLSIRSSEPGSFELVGELDAHSSPRLDELVGPLTSGPSDGLVLDLSQVAFMDSSGLRSLIDLHNRAAAAGVHLIVQAPSRPVIRLLEISGLDGVLEVVPTQ